MLRLHIIVFLLGLAVLFGAGCGGSLSPLYADFRIEEPPAHVAPDSTDLIDVPATDTANVQSIQARIAEALIAAGWELDEAPSENSVSTKEMEIAEWGLYDVRVSLDVVPINNRFVRVYVHPYRQYFYGSRSKMSYMNRRVREFVFPDLAEAFRVKGIVPLGAPPAEGQDEGDGAAPDDDEDAQEATSASRDLSPR